MGKTLIKYTVHAVGDEPISYEHWYEGKIDTCTDADELMDWKAPLNHLIEDTQYYSKFGIIANWWVDSVEYYSDCHLGMIKGFTLYEDCKKQKLSRIYKKRDISYCKTMQNCWLSPKGDIIVAPGHHVDCLDEIQDTYFNCGDDFGFRGLYDSLTEELGWLRFQNWTFRHESDMRNLEKLSIYGRKVSSKQFKMLEDFAYYWKYDFRDVLYVLENICDIKDIEKNKNLYNREGWKRAEYTKYL